MEQVSEVGGGSGELSGGGEPADPPNLSSGIYSYLLLLSGTYSNTIRYLVLTLTITSGHGMCIIPL